MALSGILNINKPAGITSRQAVDLIKRLIRPARIGHAGTLDPLATGVLVVCVGPATRLIEYVQRMPKSYVGSFILGRQSNTEDVEGEVVDLPHPPVPTLSEIQAAAKKLEGDILQRPPAFSALKINGRRAYKLARKGETVQLQPRPVKIYRITMRSYQYPQLVLEIDCGGGTYIRSLGRDLAESLGTSAVMSALVRTAIGKFTLEESLDPGKLTKDNLCTRLLPMIHAVDHLPRLVLSPPEIASIHRGQSIKKQIEGSNKTSPLPLGEGLGVREFVGASSVLLEPLEKADSAEMAAVDEKGDLVAILSPSKDDLLHPVRNFFI